MYKANLLKISQFFCIIKLTSSLLFANDVTLKTVVPYPISVKDFNYTFSTSYIYWTPNVDGMNIAYYDGATNQVGGIITPKKKGSSGFKVLLRAKTHYDDWDVSIQYTWFENQKQLTKNTLLRNITYKTPYNNTFTLMALSSYFYTQFNRINLSAERCLYESKYGILSSFTGIIGAWDNEQLRCNNNATFGVTDVLITNFNQNWAGAGPYIGIEAAFPLISHLEIFFDIGSSLLLTAHYVIQQQYITDGESGEPTWTANIKTATANVEPMVDGGIGLRANWFLSDWAIALEASWQLQTYFSHTNFTTVNAPASNMSNFSLQGLTISFRMDF